jgi:uncharacterized membrane protein YhaH (DUF805 family)
MNWYVDVLKKYAVFEGRARRQEYWMWCLLNFIIAIVLGIVDRGAGLMIGEAGTGILGLIYSLAVLCPGTAVAIRRLHDTGRSGFWLLITFVPCIGVIVLLVFLIQDSEPNANQHGPNPKGGK